MCEKIHIHINLRNFAFAPCGGCASHRATRVRAVSTARSVRWRARPQTKAPTPQTLQAPILKANVKIKEMKSITIECWVHCDGCGVWWWQYIAVLIWKMARLCVHVCARARVVCVHRKSLTFQLHDGNARLVDAHLLRELQLRVCHSAQKWEEENRVISSFFLRWKITKELWRAHTYENANNKCKHKHKLTQIHACTSTYTRNQKTPPEPMS